MRGIIWEALGDQFRKKTNNNNKNNRYLHANEHLEALGHSVSILSYLQVKVAGVDSRATNRK